MPNLILFRLSPEEFRGGVNQVRRWLKRDIPRRRGWILFQKQKPKKLTAGSKMIFSIKNRIVGEAIAKSEVEPYRDRSEPQYTARVFFEVPSIIPYQRVVDFAEVGLKHFGQVFTYLDQSMYKAILKAACATPPLQPAETRHKIRLRVGETPHFKGFSNSDFLAFQRRKVSDPDYNEERKEVTQKLLDLKKDLDPALERKGIDLDGSVSQYWPHKREPVRNCLWLRYPRPSENAIPHLIVQVWVNEVFIGLMIPGHRYQRNLIEYASKDGIMLRHRISCLPDHNSTFAISAENTVFEGTTRDIAMEHILGLQSQIPVKDYVKIGYFFKSTDRRVRGPQFVDLVAKIFFELYWLYRIVAHGWRPAVSHLKGHYPLRRYQMKKNKKYSKEVGSYHIDVLKKEKSSAAHIRITNLLARVLRMQGYECKDNPKNIDLVCRSNRGLSYLFEVKSCNERNIARQIRMGISQLYEYRYFILGKTTKLFLVTQIKPPDHLSEYLENDRNIGVLWLDEASLKAAEKTEQWLRPIVVR